MCFILYTLIFYLTFPPHFLLPSLVSTTFPLLLATVHVVKEIHFPFTEVLKRSATVLQLLSIYLHYFQKYFHFPGVIPNHVTSVQFLSCIFQNL